jgi:hypothetical protein
MLFLSPAVLEGLWMIFAECCTAGAILGPFLKKVHLAEVYV